ncbi:MAG: polysaccharide deacetylase family protein [Bacteroidia bacterium]|nr:polysaccharide deacetylase family protein [Bacteroidia bacterium]MDW8088380.1 polysaccharide deacetylase family protein [Bacteroidia bacterium]
MLWEAARVISRWLGEIPLVRRHYEGIGSILLFHRFVPPPREEWPALPPWHQPHKRLSALWKYYHPRWNEARADALCISPRQLERLILTLRHKGYTFVPLDTLLAAIYQPDPPHRLVCLTIDEGYTDLCTQALPIFERWQVPFTVYVVVAYAERRLFPWWLGLEDLLRQSRAFRLGSELYQPDGWAARGKLLLRLKARLIQYPPEEACGLVEQALRAAGLPVEPYYAATLDWAALEKLARHPLCRLGAHTLTHPCLPMLSEARAWEEIAQAKAILEARLGQPIRHFAYPYGSVEAVSLREVKMLEAAGYVSAVTTGGGSIYPEHRAMPYGLPRRRILEDSKAADLYRPRQRRLVAYPYAVEGKTA